MGRLLAEDLVRDVPDFPKPGILFKDITPVVQNHAALKEVVQLLAEWARPKQVDAVVGIEARGFIFGAPIALELGVGFVPLRKLGKLPYNRVAEEYALEYGTNTVEMHADSVQPGQNIIIIDDLLATGGTAAAAARLVERLGGRVAGFGFLIELEFLEGRKVLSPYDVHALIRYP
ncbi:MAG: adenine phosphoribosyltransferase [Chloroherpetonaceae bacterium]|nr:adenine phosphoribosyltransferase [Chthonomonadaceae bacterium]MDW8208073.1 adenine phosphoribosyltransferase [Chloroherpetonaceae bacterium]